MSNEMYKAQYARQAYLAIAKGGFREVDLCELFGVRRRQTLHDWRKRHPKFDQAIRDGREKFGGHLQDCLLKQVEGYEYEEDTYETVDGELVLVKRVKKHQPGVPSSTIFALKNICGWRDRQDLEVSGNPDRPLQIVDFSKVRPSKDQDA